MRVLLGAFGDPGHAFPMLALGSALVERGHEVALQTWRRWEDDAVAAGMTFAPAPEYQVFPTPEKPLKPYAAAVRAAREIQPFVRSFAPATRTFGPPAEVQPRFREFEPQPSPACASTSFQP